MHDIRDDNYLRSEQYKDASLLNARIQLHLRFSTNSYGWFRWVFDQLELKPNEKILEIGCGPGTLWHENGYRISDHQSVFLSDYSPGMINQALINLVDKYEFFSYITSNAMAIPFTTNSFDAVIANHMLYHVPDRQKALGEVNRVLKPGGRFYAATNGRNHLRELDEITDRYFYFGVRHYTTIHSSVSFTLENGTHQLKPWFSSINIRRYADGLKVTDPTLLLAYILSMIPKDEQPSDKTYLSNIETELNRYIVQHGSIDIQKSTGLFVCIK